MISFINIKRLIYIPFGLIRALVTIANNSARDIYNKKRYPLAIINSGCCITDDTTIGIHSSLTGPSYFNHCKIGNYSYISRGALFENVTIGNYCSVAPDVTVGLGAHPLNMFSTSPLFYTTQNPMRLKVINKDLKFEKHNPIIIGNDVWIGSKVIILNGLSIGNGAIIAAGSVVTKNVAPYSIVGGVPAKLIRYRDFNSFQNAIDNEWWNLDPYEANVLYNS